jgi:hypothetical protein
MGSELPGSHGVSNSAAALASPPVGENALNIRNPPAGRWTENEVADIRVSEAPAAWKRLCGAMRFLTGTFLMGSEDNLASIRRERESNVICRVVR